MRKRIISMILVCLMVVSLMPTMAWANPTTVAKIGETPYETVAAALKAAQTGDTIEIAAGTWGAEAIGTLSATDWNTVRYKSLTIQSAEGAEVTFTSNLYLGCDDSSTANATMTVKGLKFSNASLWIDNYVQVAVDSCTFSGSGDGAAGAIIIRDSCCTNHKTADAYPDSNVIVTNCEIDGTKAAGIPGIRLRDTGDVTLSGNTVKNCQGNGILFESSDYVNNTLVKNISVTGNTITEWNATNAEEGGRAIRAAMGTLAAGSALKINGNTFTKATLGLDEPDVIKITGAGSAAVDLENNNWCGQLGSAVSGNTAYYTVDGATPAIGVAQIGTVQYGSLADAIAAAKENETIELLSNIALAHGSSDYSLNVNKNNITIDGKDKTITTDASAAWDAYKVGGDSQRFGSYYLIKVSGQNVTLKNMTIDIKEARGVACATTASGKNVTFEKMTFKGRGSAHYYGYGTGTIRFTNCTMNTKGYGVHMAGEYVEKYDLIIEGCTIHGWNSFGGAKTVTVTDTTFFGADDAGKNDLLAKIRPYSEMTLTNCKFSEDYLSEATIYCGIDTGAETTVYLNGCKVITNDGTDSAHSVYELIDYRESDVVNNQGNCQDSIFAFDAKKDETGKYTGGVFVTKDSSGIICAEGYSVSQIGTDLYLAGKTATRADVTDEGSVIETELSEDATQDEKNAAAAVAKALQGSESAPSLNIAGGGLADASAALAADNKVQANADIATAVNNTPGAVAGSETDVAILIQTYEAVAVTDVTLQNTNIVSISVDIQPMYRKVATSSEVAAAVKAGTDNINAEAGNEGQNAVILEAAQKLDVEGTVLVRIPLPVGFINPVTGEKYVDGASIFVKHIKSTQAVYVYEGRITNGANGYFVEFLNPHGFSEFVVGAGEPVARIGQIGYETLEAAIEAVKDGETITLCKDIEETVKVSKKVTFTLEAGEYKATIEAAAGYSLSKEGNVYTVTYVCRYYTGIAITGVESGKAYTLMIGGKSIGEYQLTKKDAGWTIRTAGGQYLALSGGKLLQTANEFVWKYNGGFYASEPKSVKILFWTLNTTATYYINSAVSVANFAVAVDIMTPAVASDHVYAYRYLDNEKHEIYCTRCNAVLGTESCQYEADSQTCKYCKHSIGTNVSVDVKVITIAVYNSDFLTRLLYGKYTYTSTIVATATGSPITSVQYSTDGGKTYTAKSIITGNSKPGNMIIRVTTASGDEFFFQYSGGKVTAMN